MAEDQRWQGLPGSGRPLSDLHSCPGLRPFPSSSGSICWPIPRASLPRWGWLAPWICCHLAPHIFDGDTALHSLRTYDKAVSLARIGLRFGIRVREPDEEAAFHALRPQHHFVKVKVFARYRVHPLPFGCQRLALQPDRGTSEGAAWLVGASCDPPAQVLPLDSGHALVSKVGDAASARSKPAPVYASARTLRHICYDDPEASSSKDPWADGQDPWSKARPLKEIAAPPDLALPKAAASSAPSKLEQIEADLRQDVRGWIQSEIAGQQPSGSGTTDHESRLKKLEVGLQEPAAAQV